jgi:glucans biosynthesis protein
LFIRKDSKKLGLAPLTSMFLFGKQRMKFFPDFRPEVHDSDGLLLQPTGNEWLWRPLVNPQKEHRLSRFSANDLQGFGLLQRARDFRDYEDLESRYELRPGLWVKRLDIFPPGVLELVEIPTPSEWNDNIVAYWVPFGKYTVGQEIRWSYSLSACLQDSGPASLLRADATRFSPEHDQSPARFILDFTGDLNPPLTPKAVIEAKVEASRGEVSNLVVHTNEVAGGWRAFFDYVPAGKDPAELRLFLKSGDRVVSEIWVYQFQNL